MGCTPSKHSVCRKCNASCSPVRRSHSSHPFRSPFEDDDHHIVEHTSTTLSYLFCLDASTKLNQLHEDPRLARVVKQQPVQQPVLKKNDSDFALGVVKVNTWSKLIDDKKITNTLPKTPIGTPLGEPEMINAWELMEGLDDSSPLPPPLISSKVDHIHCFPFNTCPHAIPLDQSTLPPSQEKEMVTSRAKEKLILYFTSLRGVRKTYEDCCHVRIILKNAGFRVDERDVSMHSGFKEELKELLGDRYVGLPKVFVGRRYIGGADEIRRFHEEFNLDKVLEGCEMVVNCGGRDGEEGCKACGDIRFLLCDTCSGSCKIYYEVNSDEGKDENEVEEDSDYGFRRCPDCNENGLIRCPICCE